MSNIDWEAISKELDRPLDSRHVRERVGAGGARLKYIEGWKAIEEANRIFGHGGWSRELISLDVTTDREREGRRGQLYEVAYRAVVRVTVGNVCRDGVGAGTAVLPSHGEAHEMAAKTAETDAMKRALSTFGHPLGLALYDKEGANIGDGGDDHQEGKGLERPAGNMATASKSAPGAIDGETRDRLANACRHIKNGFELAATLVELEHRYSQALDTFVELEEIGLVKWRDRLFDVYERRKSDLEAGVRGAAGDPGSFEDVPMIEPAGGH